MKNTVSTICGYFTDNGWLNVMLTVYASRDATQLASLLRDRGGWSQNSVDWYLEEAKAGNFRVAEGGIGRDRIAVVLTGDAAANHPSHWQWTTLEYQIADALLWSWPWCDCSGTVPEWLLTGSRQFIRHLAAWSVRSVGRRYVHDEPARNAVLKTFPELDVIRQDAEHYYESIEATELLLHFAGMNSMQRFVQFIDEPSKWRQHFELAFGITVQEFYGLYEAHWSNGLPNLTIPLNIQGEPDWPTADELPRLRTVESLTPAVRRGIVQVSSHGRTGSGVVYQVDDDGTVWILTDDYLVGPDGNETVKLRFFNDDQTTTGMVRGVHPNKMVAVVSMCCRVNTEPLPIATAPLGGSVFGLRFILFAVPPGNLATSELRDATGEVATSYPGFDHTLKDNIDSERFYGGVAFDEVGSATGQVVGILSYPRSPDDQFPGLTLTEVDSVSLPLDEIVGESNRLREYDASPALPSYLELPHEDELDRREANAIRIAANTFHAFATDLGLPLPDDPVKIYSHGIWATLRSYFRREEGFEPGYSQFIGGLATRRAVYLTGADTSIRRIKISQLASRRGLLAHELTHTVFQSRLGDADWARNWPVWTYEGMAVYFTFLVGSYDRNESFSTARQDFDFAGTIPPSSTDDFYRYSDGSSCHYHCGHAAMELLASRVGVRGLVQFFENSRAGTPWQTTFQQTFGLTVSEFYDLFDQHIQAGFPVLQIPDDPFPEN